uniref:Zinc finger protein 865 n=1 Tax=Cynoglossus semilaevis TaxID=244447 RepID=A0A3P8WIS8_CYNSE
MFQFSKYPMDILEMLSGHQAHQFKGLGLERQLSHQQQVQLQHQQQLQQQHQPSAEASGTLLSGLGLGSLQSSRSNAFADSSSLFAKMSAPHPPISHQSQSSSASHSSRKSSKMSSSSGNSASGYPQFLRPFHPAEAALAQEQLHSGMGRFDFGGSSSAGSAGVIGGVVTPAPPPPPLHPGLSVPQPSPGPSSSSASPATSASAANNPSGSTTVPLVGQSDPRSLHQQFSCMLAANQYFLSGVPANSSLEQFLVQQGTHNHLGLGLSQGPTESNSGLPPTALHSSHSHPTSQPQQQQQQLTPHALPHPHSHAHHPHPLHPAPQPAPLGGFDFQGIPVLSSNQIASLMQQETGLPLPIPLHLSISKDDASKSGDTTTTSASSGGSRRKKAMAGYLPQRKADSSSHSSHSSSSSSSSNSSSSGHSQSSSSGVVGGAGSTGVAISGISSEQQHSSLLTSSSQRSSSSVSSSSSNPSSSNPTSVLVANGNQQLPKDRDTHRSSTSDQSEPEPLYHCGECGKTFTHLSSLRRHLRSHGLTPESHSRKLDCNTPSPERIFCCGECGKRFKKRGHLIQHSVTHSENRPFACSICQKSFNRRESLTRHEKIHDEKPFRCPACGRCFRESTALLNHAASGACGKPPRNSKKQANSGGSSSSNPGSSKMGSSGDRVGILNNGVTMTNDKYAPEYSKNRYPSQSSFNTGVDIYRRSQSSSMYSSGSTLASEMSAHTLRKAPLAPTLHPHPQNHQQHHHHQQQPQQQQQTHLPLSSLLDDSEDEVTSSAMSAIAAAAAASCDLNSEGRDGERRDIIGGLLGGLGFGSLGGPPSTPSLNGSTVPLTHPRHIHTKPRRPRKPREKRDPNSVVRRRRSPAPPGDGSERPYGCHICGKRFRRAETLRRHNRVHTGEKPHSCEVCGKMFREPFHLTKHLTVHSGQKNYKCNLCGKMFAYAQSLVRHGKLHRRGEIDNQGRRIKGAAAVNQVSGNSDYFSSCSQGEKSPTSGTPSHRLYTCTVCWKSFRHYFNMTAHQQTVHGGVVGREKSYRCDVCGKAFAYSNSLVRHKLSQHGIDRNDQRVTQTQPTGFSPLFYDTAPGPNYTGLPHMHQGAPRDLEQHHHLQNPFCYRSKNFQKQHGHTRKQRKKRRRVEIHSIMRDGKLVGFPLSKDTRRKLTLLRKKRGRLQAQIKKKKLLAQLRMKGGTIAVKAWSGGAVKVTGLTSLDIQIKRFPCPICPSTMYARLGSLLLHHAVRHPPHNSDRRARLLCQVCGRQTSSLHKALKHRGQHLKRAAFQCHRCRNRFWNPRLLDRHRFSCRGMGSGTWELMTVRPVFIKGYYIPQ